MIVKRGDIKSDILIAEELQYERNHFLASVVISGHNTGVA
jgi:hypothetical protein